MPKKSELQQAIDKVDADIARLREDFERELAAKIGSKKYLEEMRDAKTKRPRAVPQKASA